MKKFDECGKIVFGSSSELAWVLLTFNDHIYQIIAYLDELDDDHPVTDDIGEWGICGEINRESFDVFGHDDCIKLLRKLAIDNDVI